MLGQPPAAIEGAAQAGGPWSKAPPWPIREGETGFPFADDVLGPIGQQQPLPPLGEAAGGSKSGQPNGGQPVIAGGKIVPVFTEEELAQLAEYLGMDRPPSSPGPLPPSPTVTPKPTSFGGSPTTTQGSTTTGGSPATVVATTVAVNDSPFIHNGVCTGLPAFAGPDVYTNYFVPGKDFVLGKSQNKELEDAENRGVIIGKELDTLSRQLKNRPFYEASDMPTLVNPDSWFSDDSYMAWFEITSVRTYNEYTRLPGATLSNATQNQAGLKMGVSRTGTNSWTVGGSSGLSLGREASAKFLDIGVAVNQALETQLSISRSVQESITVNNDVEFTVAPCDVVSVFEGYTIVQMQVNYIYMDDTAFGSHHGFEVKRGTEALTSKVYTGLHALSASEWLRMQQSTAAVGGSSQSGK